MNQEIQNYNEKQELSDFEICDRLAGIIDEELKNATSKIWHAHPVWFLNENPVVGYSKQKAGIRLMFWSGKDFGIDELNVQGKKFKDASIFYTSVSEIDPVKIKHWLKKSIEIQWDYKNIVKKRGQLDRLI
jgi:hypothetical protein